MLEGEFSCAWGVWFIYQGASYDGNVHLVFQVRTPTDLSYLWRESPLNSLTNYFLKENLKQVTYQVADKWRKVNSIEYFRKGIEPRWEDKKNENGGRFVFQVSRTQPNQEEIYSHMVFFFMGEDFEQSQKVNGFRFISSKTPSSISYRIEVWVNFDDQDTNSIRHFQDKVFINLFDQLKFEHKKISFTGMKGDAKEAEAKEKEKAKDEGTAK